MNKQSAINIYKKAAQEGGLTPERQTQLKTKLLGLLDNLPPDFSGRSMEPRRRRIFPSVVMVPLFVVVLLFAGTVGGAQVALPGDGLYTVKRWTEKVEVSWAMSDEGNAKAYARQANIRLDELEAIKLKQTAATEDRAALAGYEELSRQEARMALEAALNRLTTLKLQQEEKHNETAAKALNDIQEKLEARASQSSYIIDIEKDTGRVKVAPKTTGNSLNSSESERKDADSVDERSSADN
jgi:hypothetical protein